MHRIIGAALGCLLLMALGGEMQGQEPPPAARLRPVQAVPLGPFLTLFSVDEADATFDSGTRVVPQEEGNRTRNVILGALLGAGGGLTALLVLRACADRGVPLDPWLCDRERSAPEGKAWVALPLFGAVVGAVVGYHTPVKD